MESRIVGVVAIVVVGIVALTVGILIGHFAIKKPGVQTLQQRCRTERDPLENEAVNRYMSKSEEEACRAIKCDLPYPVSYVAYHLGGASITVDGRLDEDAWQETPKIDKFVNILGEDHPAPWYNTTAMLRWDDEFLYIGARLQEKDVWASRTRHDTRIWLDNCFEVFVDTDFTTHNYKEWQINALNTTWDLLLTKPYINEGTNISAWELAGGSWSVYVDGTVNDATDRDKYWSMEVAMPFSALVQENIRQSTPPSDGDQWRINLSRVEYELEVESGSYRKKANKTGNFWVWSPQYTAELHLPERWGFVQFSRGLVGSSPYQKWPQWPVYSSMMATYDSMRAYAGVNGKVPKNISELTLPPYVLSHTCSQPPTLKGGDDVWSLEVRPSGGGKVGQIKQDRYITFS